MKQIKIEYLCPEFCHFYGDHGNLLYLQKKAALMGNEVHVVKTPRGEMPQFTRGGVDLLYIGPTTDAYQPPLIDTLNRVKPFLKEYIENGGYVLATGNALEIFYQSIKTSDGALLSALKLFPFEAEQFEGKRYSVNVVGDYHGLSIAGYKNLASRTTTQNNPYPLFSVIKEAGTTRSGEWEGIHYRNFFGTYLLGPLLLQNPEFSNELLQGLFGEDYKEVYLPFEKEAHDKRVHDILHDKNPDHNG